MAMMDNTNGMLLLTKCLDPRNTTMMTEVVKILAAMSIVNEKAWVQPSAIDFNHLLFLFDGPFYCNAYAFPLE